MQKNQAKQYIDKVISQQPSGAFTWFKGMPDSRYITQEILLNWARLGKMTKSDILTDYRLPITAALYTSIQRLLVPEISGKIIKTMRKKCR